MSQYSEAIRAVFTGELLEQEPLSLHTSLKVGGPADIFAIPRDVDDLQRLLMVCGNVRVNTRGSPGAGR